MENPHQEMKRLVTSGAAALLLVLIAAPAAAQVAPQYVSSTPEDGETVHQAPARVEVEFDQPLDDSSSLAVTDECDRQLDDGSTEVDGNTMSIEIVETPAGDYHVEYIARGVEGVTGENEGHFTFTVHAGESCDGKKHGHHGNGGKKNDGHGGHEREGGKHSGKHDDMDHDDMDHEDMDHDEHAAVTHEGDHRGGSGHGKDHGKHDKHADGKNDDPTATGEIPGITSSDTARNLLARADSAALIASLLLCALVGILGGVILRTSARRSA